MRVFAFLPLLLFGRVAIGNPIDSRDVVAGHPVQPSPETSISSPPSDQPLPTVHALPANQALSIGETSGKNQTTHDGFHHFVAALPDSFMICGGYHCDGHCVYWKLSSLRHRTCYAAPFKYNSAIIIRNTGAGLYPGIASGGPSCSQRWTLPYVNTCYKWNSPRWTFYRG